MAWTIHESAPVRINGDREVLAQVLNNLLDNAVKFTDRGKVELSIQAEGEADGRYIRLRCAVKDSGRGVPHGQQKVIFKEFTQGEWYSTRSQDGSGLGLAICHRLVALMDGAIWLESQVNRGSTFHFTARVGVEPESLFP